MKALIGLVAVVVIFLVLLAGGAFYTVGQTDTVILTQFGRMVGAPISEPGLHWKTPFVQEVNRLEKRVLEFDGPTTDMVTKDKTYIEVDTFARWRIADPAAFYVQLGTLTRANSRLEDIIGSEVRAAVASHELIEIIRSDKSRVVAPDVQAQSQTAAALRVATRGRIEIERDILKEATPKLTKSGIELLDVRFKRVNYNASNMQPIYQRMSSERAQIALRFRSEGEGEALRIAGTKERELRRVESDAYRTVHQTRGEADAEAMRIYAEAYGKSPEARELYAFLKTMETYRTVLAGSNLVLSTESELFRLLKHAK